MDRGKVHSQLHCSNGDGSGLVGGISKRAVHFPYLWHQGGLSPSFFIFMIVVVTAAFACFCLTEILESDFVRYHKPPAGSRGDAPSLMR